MHLLRKYYQELHLNFDSIWFGFFGSYLFCSTTKWSCSHTGHNGSKNKINDSSSDSSHQNADRVKGGEDEDEEEDDDDDFVVATAFHFLALTLMMRMRWFFGCL